MIQSRFVVGEGVWKSVCVGNRGGGRWEVCVELRGKTGWRSVCVEWRGETVC